MRDIETMLIGFGRIKSILSKDKFANSSDYFRFAPDNRGILKDYKGHMIDRKYRESMRRLYSTFCSLQRSTILSILKERNKVNAIDLKEYGFSRQLSYYHFRVLEFMGIVDSYDISFPSPNSPTGFSRVKVYSLTRDFYNFLIRSEYIINELNSIRQFSLTMLQYYSENLPDCLHISNEDLCWWEFENDVDYYLEKYRGVRDQLSRLGYKIKTEFGVNPRTGVEV